MALLLYLAQSSSTRPGTLSNSRVLLVTSTAQTAMACPAIAVSFRPIGVRETPRNISFCGHAILQEGAFIIHDAAVDERFHDNPLVTGEPHIRFYAGRSVSLPDGTVAGTLCLIPPVPLRMKTFRPSGTWPASWSTNSMPSAWCLWHQYRKGRKYLIG